MRTKDILKRHRLDAGLTQVELAKEIGTTQRNVSYWETGVTQPSIKNAKKLSKLYGVPISELSETTE